MLSLLINNYENTFKFTLYFKDKVLFDGVIDNMYSDECYFEIRREDLYRKNNDEVNSLKDAFILMSSLLLCYDALASLTNVDEIVIEGANEELVNLVSYFYSDKITRVSNNKVLVRNKYC